jgi:energy-coupling factor transporter ATP-binding protein EcfA2
MSTIEQELADWAKTRHPWQQYALRRIVIGQPFMQADVVKLADEIIANKYTKPATPALKAADISGGSDPEATVALKCIRDLSNVNALLEAQELTFAETGLTVVFGDNGSGKSGYARIIKDVASALHHQQIHGNVFEATATDPQRADITYLLDGQEESSTWPNAADDLKAVSFYDEACGDKYLTGDSEMTYRPSALAIIDALIALCDAVRSEIESRVGQNKMNRGPLPVLATGTPAASFVSKLNSTTTEAELDAARALPEDWEARNAWLIQEEARLTATNPIKERVRLQGLAAMLDEISTHVGGIEGALSDTRVDTAKQARQKATELRAAADLASSVSFDDEPLPGVGTLTWRSLWEAARKYSEQEAYKTQSFPVTSEGAHCVLCQQVLGPEAADRLGRFHQFLTDTTATSAEEAELALRGTKQSINGLELTPARISSLLVTVEVEEPDLAKRVTEWVTLMDERKDAVLQHLSDGGDFTPSATEGSPQAAIDARANSLRDKAKEVEIQGFQDTLQQVTIEKDDLSARSQLAAGRDAVKTEITRLGALKTLEDAKKLTATTAISKKASELTEEHVTALVRNEFIRETERLKLKKIDLKKTGGQKGRLKHRPSLLGAKVSKPVDEVLSEGEQTALGLAGFFTEAHFDSSKSALVLDDPVTSLDHIRREYVAHRLVEFSGDRQVIVFTHDLAFLRDIVLAARSEQVTITERMVQHRGSQPGLVSNEYPWKAKDVGSRMNELTQLLAELKKKREALTQGEYEDACAGWAGKLSETWERIVSMEIVDPVFTPVEHEVRPRMFKVFRQITDDDDKEFQDSYGRCSLWARRHDKSQAFNYVAPEIYELEGELAHVKEWHARIRQYKNNN